MSKTAKEGKAGEVEETLGINLRNAQGEEGNVVYAPHRPTENQDEFWIHEPWESKEAVEDHASSARFEEYEAKLHPLVDPRLRAPRRGKGLVRGRYYEAGIGASANMSAYPNG